LVVVSLEFWLRMKSWQVLLLSLVVLAGLTVAWPRPAGLVVYCAHDAVYSEAVLRRFERETGIQVVIRFDTEATKSLSLVNRLVTERHGPQCDLFWNNEQLGTMSLAEAGLLEPYQGPGYQRIPEKFRDPEGCWTGFAARLRVVAINTDRMAASEAEVSHRMSGDLSRLAIAVPIYGTTLTHYSRLWEAWGADRLQAWDADVRRRGAKFVPGNGRVMTLVAEGLCDFGWTDTDDYFVSRDDGKPVAMLPARVDGSTIVIPNTVAIIKGCRHPAEARRLVDFLLSAQVELELARSQARQIPLGLDVSPETVPEEVRALQPCIQEACELRSLLAAREACLSWLQRESTP